MQNNHQLTSLAMLYRMYLNEFISVGGFADWLGADDGDALIIIEQGRKAHNTGF